MLLSSYSISASAQTVVTVNNIHYIIENDEAVVGRQDKNLKGDIIIPSTIEHEGRIYSVTRIINPIDTHSYGGMSSISADEAAFQGTSIASITLPSTITSISTCAFINCSNLQKVVLPETLTSIGWGAFAYCSSLTQINLPQSLQYLSSWSFGGCSSLKSIEIPSSITVFPDAVFKDCGFETFEIPANTTRLGRESLNMYSLKTVKSYIRDITRMYCHDECFGTVTEKNLLIPNGSKFIYQEYNPWRKFATIEEFDDGHTGEPINPKELIATIDNIRYTVYEDGTAILIQQNETLTGDIIIPETIDVSGKSYTVTGIIGPNDTHSWGGMSSISADGAAFQGTSITSITLPSTITSISTCAFINCSNLQKVVLPETLTSIGWGAFAYCSSLKEINLPQSLQYLSAWCLAGCAALEEISIPAQITEIPSACFKGSGLKSLDLNENIKTLGNLSLNTSTLVYIKIYNTKNDLYASENAFGTYDNIQKTKVFVPKGCKSHYSAIYPWVYFNAIEEFGYSIILDYNEGGFISSTKSLALYEDDEIVIKITPDTGHRLKNITVNNADITGMVNNGEYVLRNINEDTYVVAKFEICSYKMSYVVDNEVYKEVEYDYGAIITPEPAPTKEGYNFSGWSEIPATMPAHDVTVTGTFTIVDPVTITAKSYSRKYGEANPTFEYTTSGATLTGTPEITCEATATSPVGEYDIVVSKGSITNYNVTLVNGKLTVTKAPLTITAKSYTIKQGDALPTFEAEYAGFKNNETNSVLTTQPTITTTATSASAPGTYEIVVSGASATNYDITYVKGTLTISAVEVEPVTETETTTFSEDVNENTDLSNTIIDNTYYTMNAENGDGYDATEQAIVLNSTTTTEQMNAVQNAQVGDATMQANFNGIIFEVPAGNGTITVEVKTLGSHVLNVQIGNGVPNKITKSERGTADVPYNVTKPTYVYLYASTSGASGAPQRAAAANSVLLYSYKVDVLVNGISVVTYGDMENAKWYTTDGIQLQGKPTTKGLYIVNGRKVVVK